MVTTGRQYDVDLEHHASPTPSEGFRTHRRGNNLYMDEKAVEAGMGELKEEPEYLVGIRGNDAKDLVRHGCRDGDYLKMTVKAEEEMPSSSSSGFWNSSPNHKVHGTHTEYLDFTRFDWDKYEINGDYTPGATLPEDENLLDYVEEAIDGEDITLKDLDRYTLDFEAVDMNDNPIPDNNGDPIASNELHIEAPEVIGKGEATKELYETAKDVKDEVDQHGVLGAGVRRAINRYF